jgi:hypothetical protein
MARYIDINFARRDDCLDNMTPSDLRMLVAERDELLEQRDKMLGMIKALSGSPNIINTRLKIQARGLINEIEQSKQTREGG